MFINPKEAIHQEWIVFPDWMSDQQKSKCIQPNAIDFTIDRLFNLRTYDVAILSEDKSNCFFRNSEEILPNEDNQWCLEKNTTYDALSDFYVEVPDGVACQLINRSSFSRSGVILNCGLYDTGFKGNIGFTLFNQVGPLRIESHMRVGQIIFISSDSQGSYSGGYNTDKGSYWRLVNSNENNGNVNV